MDVTTLWPVVSHALTYGVILSGVLFALILGVTRINPEIMLKNYPPDVRAKYGSMSARSKRQRIPVAIVVVALLFGIVALSFQGVRKNASGDISFAVAFIHLLVMFSAFNLFDLLLLDWLIVVAIRPKFMILPGTEGLPGYADYGIHFRGFLIGVMITFVASLLVAGVIAALF